MNKHLFYNLKVQLFFALVFLLSSCVSTKNITYLQNSNQSGPSILDSTANFQEPKIQPDDILSISIVTIDPASASADNQISILSGMSSSNNGSEREGKGFLVNKNGEVELAIIGKVKVAGLTTTLAKELIREKASKDFKEPNVDLRFANFRISVLGEVTKPGAYIIPNEKVSILDVLSLAGDLTLYGKRTNILVFREVDGKKLTGRLDITSVDLFKNPFYYLKQNDVVYIEPSKAKIATLNAPTRTTIGIVLSSISVLVLAFTRVF